MPSRALFLLSQALCRARTAFARRIRAEPDPGVRATCIDVLTRVTLPTCRVVALYSSKFYCGGVAVIESPQRRAMVLFGTSSDDGAGIFTETEMWTQPSAGGTQLPAIYAQSILDAVRNSRAGSSPRPRVLMLGLGGGAILTAIRDENMNARCTVVERDEAVVGAAVDHFGLEPGRRMVVCIDDALAFVLRTARQGCKFDVIIVDLFTQGAQPAFMMSDGFLRALRTLLANGFLVVNGVCQALSEKLHQTFVADSCLCRSFRTEIPSGGHGSGSESPRLAFVDFCMPPSTDETEIAGS